MNILLPWSLASYIPLNGFHPLYRSLASLEPGPTRLLVPRPLSREQHHQLIMAGVYKPNALPRTPGWARDLNQGFDFRDYASGHVPAELLYTGRISADVELHHTAPVTLGTRPFVLQFESFLPVFFPHFQQGTGLDERKVTEIRRFYARVLESAHCLAVTSHIRSSLDQLSDFFRSTAIDDKLVHLRNGIDPVFRAARGVRRDPECVDFLFLNSAHQNPASFALRGGVACLAVALDLLREGRPARFFFRTQRPSDTRLEEFGIDPMLVRQYENSAIVWIEGYMADDALNRLMAQCHFLLLPSANLHSLSILSAMLNGTIPVVTDTYGTDAYVTDDVDAIVLSGVRAAAWRHDPDRRIVVDDHAAYHARRADLADALHARLREVLDHPQRIAALSAAARRRVSTDFDGSTFASGLIDLVRSRFMATGRPLVTSEEMARDIYDVAWGEEWTADLSPAHFDGPPHPVPLLDVGSGKIFRLRNLYVFVPNARLGETAVADWSELQFAAERTEVADERRKTVSTDFEAAVEAGRVAALRQAAARAATPEQPGSEMPLSFKERVYHTLQTRPAVLRLARTTYRSLRRAGIMR